jgi:hypothetical protein
MSIGLISVFWDIEILMFPLAPTFTACIIIIIIIIITRELLFIDLRMTVHRQLPL